MKAKINRKIMAPVLVFMALIIFGAPAINAAPGDLDLSFGSGGVVVTPIADWDISLHSTNPTSILTQPDGRILVCGMIYDDGDNEESFFLARYHPNGTIDTSFGTRGKIIGPAYADLYTGSHIALQPDGKIVSVGFTYSHFAVHRYNANGTLDASFGTGGLVITRVGTGLGIGLEAARSVTVQADGKIVVVGVTEWTNLSTAFALARYHPDGSLDTSFNGTGKVITSFGYGSTAFAAVLQPDGKIVAAGCAKAVNGTSAFALARYNTDGSLDPSFGVGGKVIHAISTDTDYIYDVVLQPDGKLVATGFIARNTNTGSAVVRYETNGSVDMSFGQNGIFTTNGSFIVGFSVARQSDGKLVAFGYSYPPYGSAITRLNLNGTLDPSFGSNGRVIRSNQRSHYAGAIQSDGKILAVGGGYLDTKIEIVRYLGDSAAPRPTQFDFDGDGKADISVFRPSDRTWYLNRSTSGFAATQFGLSNDRITPADFDGDGKTDIAVYRNGFWYWLNSSNGNFNAIQFGLASDLPVPADFTGDGRAELAVYRGGIWWSLDLSNNQVGSVQFGLLNDKPVTADYDGDGRADQAVYRDGVWHLNRSSQVYTAIQFGLPTDKPVPADYDGDGRADQAVNRDGTWYLLQSTSGFTAFQFGISTDIPAPADYDADGKTDAAVYRNGTWYLRQSTGGQTTMQFGLANDRPLPAAYVQ